MADPLASPSPSPPGTRWVAYVDMDAFYVACELRDRPELGGTPVIVGPDPKLGPTRGVVLSASYEARAFGVRSAQPAGLAASLCPTATWIPADFRKYERAADEVRTFLRSRSPRVVVLSIDEAAVTCPGATAGEAERFARELQAGLRTSLRLPASLGVATHRAIAKIASDRAKPGGVVVVPPEHVAEFLAPLPVGVIPGVGPKTRAVLAGLGVETIGQLAEAPAAKLRRQLGGFAVELRALARGEALPEPQEEHGPRSRSAAHTLAADTSDRSEIERHVAELAAGLAASLAAERLRYQTVSLAIRWEDFDRVQRSRTLRTPATGTALLAGAAGQLLGEILAGEAAGRRRRVRAISVQAERLTPEGGGQRRLDDFAGAAAGTVK